MTYVYETVIDGKAERISLTVMPTSIIARLYEVPVEPALVLLAEKVLK